MPLYIPYIWEAKFSYRGWVSLPFSGLGLRGDCTGSSNVLKLLKPDPIPRGTELSKPLRDRGRQDNIAWAVNE